MAPNGLLELTGEDWKRARQILSPTFSPFKMKAVSALSMTVATHNYIAVSAMKMTALIERNVESLVEVFKECASKEQSTEVFR